MSWAKSILYLHEKKENDLNSQYYKRLAYDEILSNLLVLSHVRKRIKKFKKKNKVFDNGLSNELIKNFNFTLTHDQKKVVDEINYDLQSDHKMFRILQGDVGTGKTIVSFIGAANVIKSNYQAVMMAPTEILAKQHFDLAKKIFKSTKVTIEFLSGRIKPKDKKIIQENLLSGRINFLIGTHALFQKNILFKNLG